VAISLGTLTRVKRHARCEKRCVGDDTDPIRGKGVATRDLGEFGEVLGMRAARRRRLARTRLEWDVAYPQCGFGADYSKVDVEELWRAIWELQEDNDALRSDLREQWACNHSEHCDAIWPHPDDGDICH
jgi:hypothetical protein